MLAVHKNLQLNVAMLPKAAVLSHSQTLQKKLSLPSEASCRSGLPGSQIHSAHLRGDLAHQLRVIPVMLHDACAMQA